MQYYRCITSYLIFILNKHLELKEALKFENRSAGYYFNYFNSINIGSTLFKLYLIDSIIWKILNENSLTKNSNIF